MVGRFLATRGIVDLMTGTTLIREEHVTRHEFSVYRDGNLALHLDLKTTSDDEAPGIRIGETEHAVNNNWHDFQFTLGSNGFSQLNPEAVRADRPVRLVLDYRPDDSPNQLIGFMFASNVDQWALFHGGTILASRTGFENGPIITAHDSEPALEPPPPTTTEAPTPIFSFTQDSYTVTEGETVSIGVRKSGGAATDFSLVRVGGSVEAADFALDAQDEVEISTGQRVRVDTAVGRFNLLGIQIGAEDAEVVIPLPIQWDSLSETPETLVLQLEPNIDFEFEFGEYRTTTITILNVVQTTPAKPVIQWRAEDLAITINEHGGTDTGHQFVGGHYTPTIEVEVRLDIQPAGAVPFDNVMIGVSGTAAGSIYASDGDDFSITQPTVTQGPHVIVLPPDNIRSGLTSVRFDVLVDQTHGEPDETIILTLQPDDSAYDLGANTVATITITDIPPTTQPPPPQVVSWESADYSGVEPVAGEHAEDAYDEVRISVSRVGGIDRPVLFDISHGASVVSGTDHTRYADGIDLSVQDVSPVSGSPNRYQLAADRSTFTLRIYRDDLVEGDETVTLTLIAGDGYTFDETDDRHITTVTLTDNPPPQTVGWGSTAYSGVEPVAGEHAEDAYERVRVTITRDGGVDRPVLFDVSHGAGVVLGTAYADDVDVVMDGVVSTDVNNRYQLAADRNGFYLRVHRDYLLEGDETLTLILVQGPGYVPDTAANRHIATVTLTDTPPLPIPAGERWFEWSLTIEGRGARYIHYRVNGEFRTRNTTGTIRESDVYYHVARIEIINTNSDTTSDGAVIDLVNGELNGSAEGITVYHDFEFELPGVDATGPFYFSVNSQAQDPAHATIFMAERTSDSAKWGTHNHLPLRFWDTFSASENPITLTSPTGPVVSEKIRQ